jgi:RHS repeat-associated protein/uncharacterized delta-60 repeat protein
VSSAAVATLEALEQRQLLAFSALSGPDQIRPRDIKVVPEAPVFGGTKQFCAIPLPPAQGGNGSYGPSAVSMPPILSAGGVFYGDGAPVGASTDLTSSGFGFGSGVTRAWSGLSNPSGFGNGWNVTQLPYLAVAGADGDLPVVSQISSGAIQRVYTIGKDENNNDKAVPLAAYANESVAITSSGFVFKEAGGYEFEFNDLRRSGGALVTNNPIAREIDPTTKYSYGAFKSARDPYGNETIASYGNTTGLLATLVRKEGGTELEKFVYTYTTVTNTLSPSGSLTLVSKVEQQHYVSGAWKTVRSSEYTYYTGQGSEASNGRLGDLKLVTNKDHLVESTGKVIDQKYYRYYKFSAKGTVDTATGANDPAKSGGPTALFAASGDNIAVSGIKMVFEGAAFARLAANFSDYATRSDAEIAPYASNYFKSYERWGDQWVDGNSDSDFLDVGDYKWGQTHDQNWFDAYRTGSQFRVTEQSVQGLGCSSCSGGQGSFKFEYFSNSGATTELGWSADDHNVWRTKMIEYQPDTTDSTWADNDRRTVYRNELGQTMMIVTVDARGTTSTSDDVTYSTFYRYDTSGRVTSVTDSSALATYDHASPSSWENNKDLLGWVELTGNFSNLNDSSGRIVVYEFATTTTATDSAAGDAAGFLNAVKIKNGESGSLITQSVMTYIKRVGTGQTVFAPAIETVYSDTAASLSTARKTTYTYNWYGSTVQMQSKQTTHEVVTPAQNGSDLATSRLEYFDGFGRVIWTKNEAGYINRTVYDAETGGVTKQITDVNTASVSDEPSGWTTISGAGLHLVTDYVIDDLGRPLKTTDPESRVVYYRYDDSKRETRTYVGWGSTMVPTQVSREYWPVAGETDANKRTVFRETLSFHEDTSGTYGSTGPTGTESIDTSEITALGRQLTNNAGQTVESHQYFSLSGLTYSTDRAVLSSATASNDSSTGHYHKTEYGYDGRGRLKSTFTPAGTITRNFYDARNLQTNQWIGTDDIPTTGFWSPSNNTGANMTEVWTREYDSNGNLTKTTQKVGGSEADRLTQNWYDWRNRLVVSKAGVETTESTSVNRPITYREYNNLGEVIATEQYDGDNVTITTTANLPNRPSSSLLRAKTTADYDSRGRAFRSTVFSVDPVDGTVGNSLKSEKWFDSRGLVIKAVSPGAAAKKMFYDGAGRVTKSFTTDAAGDTTYANAQDVADDTVLEQTEYTYDGASNQILVTVRQRFHDASGTGELVNASSSTHCARVSHVAIYYDSMNRMTDTVNVGTFAGSSYTRPSTVPSRSDTTLVTSYTYNSAGQLSLVTSPRDGGGVFERTLTEFDMLGRANWKIEAWDGTSPAPANSGNGNNRITRSTFTGDGKLRSVTGVMASGVASQVTEYVYTDSAAASAIISNNLLHEVRYPNLTTGAASSAQADKYVYNALGQRTKMTDRNGTVHEYTYDVVGRLVADTITTLGTNIDGGVRRIGNTYDSAGRLEKATSYSNNAGTTVVNEVVRKYNGFGQLTHEYQNPSGAVNTSTSPVVVYVYSEASGGNHSRLTTVTYPNGRQIQYNYSIGLNSSISRLSSVVDLEGSDTTLEAYDYLGLSTVVRRSHPEPDLDLTHITAGTIFGDAGDRYVGLDRFGRVVDQRWTQGGQDVDRYKYGYDRSGNRTYKENTQSSLFSEIYVYDDLNRLTGTTRGQINSTKNGIDIGTNPVQRSQSWNLDTLGNWSSATTDGVSETRTHNSQNQLTGVGSATLGYDANGSLTEMKDGTDVIYDAWNRVIKVTKPYFDQVGYVCYEYDAFGRRIERQIFQSSVLTGTQTQGTWFFYSSSWQLLEERDKKTDGTTPTMPSTAKYSYVWSPVYVDAMIARDEVDYVDPGTLDTSFSGDGYTTVDFSGSDTGSGAILHEDGSMVLVGTQGGNVLAIARLLADGSLDTSFSTDGKATLDISGGTERANGLLALPDGSYLVYGTFYPTSGNNQSLIVRYLADGTLDTSFNLPADTDGNSTNGVNILDIAGLGYHDYANDAVIDADGALVLLHTVNYTGYRDIDVVLQRYTLQDIGGGVLDYRLDTTFGTSGSATFDSGYSDYGQAVIATGSGSGRQYTVGGFRYSAVTGTGTDFLALRVNHNGSLDTAFGTSGWVIPARSGEQLAFDVLVQSDGKILLGGYDTLTVSGTTSRDAAVLRLNSNGTVDATFGNEATGDRDGVAGWATLGTVHQDNGQRLFIQEDGKILLTSFIHNTTAGIYDLGLMRLRADGTADPLFSGDGWGTYVIAGNERPSAVFSPAGDKLLITGDIGWDMLVVKMHLPPVTKRLYAMHDANFNVTGLVTSDGEVAQRYAYDAYGTYSILNEDWVQSTPAAGYINWVYLHQGGRLDSFTGLYHFRNRDYDPTLGRWLRLDPLGYIDGLNGYLGFGGSPARNRDPSGLHSITRDPNIVSDVPFLTAMSGGVPAWGSTGASIGYRLVSSFGTVDDCGCCGVGGKQRMYCAAVFGLYEAFGKITVNVVNITLDAKTLALAAFPSALTAGVAAFNQETVDHEQKHVNDIMRIFSPDIFAYGFGFACGSAADAEKAAEKEMASDFAGEQARRQSEYDRETALYHRITDLTTASAESDLRYWYSGKRRPIR